MEPSSSRWRRVPAVALFGGVAWLVLVAGRLAGLTRLTLIDVLYLLAPLVVVPLGLRLIQFDTGLPQALLRAALFLQPVGAALATVAFLVPIGIPAAALAGAWLLVCAIGGLAALGDLVGGRSLQPIRLATAAAIGYLAFGAVWLVLSRAGITPLGLPPVIVELTAVHFHFTGFAATLMAALTLGRLRDERSVFATIALVASLLMVAGSPVLAAGWGTPVHALQVVGAILVAAGVIGTAFVAFFRSATLVFTTPARVLLRLSALSPLLPMALALEYSAGRNFGFPTLDIQQMALIHGDLNALGFSLLGLLGWTLAGAAYRESGTVSRTRGMTSLANSSS